MHTKDIVCLQFLHWSVWGLAEVVLMEVWVWSGLLEEGVAFQNPKWQSVLVWWGGVEHTHICITLGLVALVCDFRGVAGEGLWGCPSSPLVPGLLAVWSNSVSDVEWSGVCSRSDFSAARVCDIPWSGIKVQSSGHEAISLPYTTYPGSFAQIVVCSHSV